MAVIGTAILLCSAPGAARAGTYDVVACNAPGANLINRAWTVETYNFNGGAAPPASSFFTLPSATDVSKCNAGYGVSLQSLNARRTVKASEGAAWTFHAPEGTTVQRIQIWRFGEARASTDDTSTAPVESNVWQVIFRAGNAPGGSTTPGGPPATTDWCAGPPSSPTQYCMIGNSPFAPASFVTYDDVDRPVIQWGIECAGPQTQVCFTADTANAIHAAINLEGARVTVEDLVAPAVAFGGAPGGWHRAVEGQTASATDSAGIREIRVLVDGTERATTSPTCDFHLHAPCPTLLTTPFDFAGVPDGPHTVSMVAEDTAGNVASTERTIDIDGTAPTVDLLPVSGRTIKARVSDAGSGLAGGTIAYRRKPTGPFVNLRTARHGSQLVARVPQGQRASSVGIRVSVADAAGNTTSDVATSMSLNRRVGKTVRKVRAGRVSVPYGRPATFSGRITTTDGVPLAGQTVSVTSTLRQTAATLQPFATVTTDARGRFSFTLPAGPARLLSVEYRGGVGFLRRIRSVTVRVPAAATIHASDELISGRTRVRFFGRLLLLGTQLPPGGKLVDLQAFANAHWMTVATTRADGPSATWRASAPFSGRPGRYPVRLRIRRERVFPYDLGYSPSVVVRVR